MGIYDLKENPGENSGARLCSKHNIFIAHTAKLCVEKISKSKNNKKS